MASVTNWYGERIDKLRQLSTPRLLLLITVKFLAGVAIGLLLAMWLPAWVWWIFLVAALLLAIPLYAKLFS